MEPEHFNQEILPLRKKLLKYAHSILDNPEDAEDVVQEVMMKLWYMRKELHKYESVTALSVQITKHLCLNRLKVVQRKMESLEGFSTVELRLESDIPSPHTQLEQKDDVSYLMKIIDQLPHLQQTILRMRHIDGLELDEIVALTGIKPEAVRMNLSRARKKIKELFFRNQIG